jgi:hypothetical protein
VNLFLLGINKNRLRYGIHMSGWNKGFGLPHELIDRMTVLGVDLEFDLYAYGEEDV